MANLLPFMMMTREQAARFRESTIGEPARLEPRLVAAGPYAGKYALPNRVQYDPAFADHRDAFALLTVISFDADEAWPMVDN